MAGSSSVAFERSLKRFGSGFLPGRVWYDSLTVNIFPVSDAARGFPHPALFRYSSLDVGAIQGS